MASIWLVTRDYSNEECSCEVPILAFSSKEKAELHAFMAQERRQELRLKYQNDIKQRDAIIAALPKDDHIARWTAESSWTKTWHLENFNEFDPDVDLEDDLTYGWSEVKYLG